MHAREKTTSFEKGKAMTPRLSIATAGLSASAPARRPGLGTWLKKRAAPLIAFALLFALWESAVSLTGIKEYLLPPPSTVWAEFLKRSDTVIAGAWVTTQEIIARSEEHTSELQSRFG